MIRKYFLLTFFSALLFGPLFCQDTLKIQIPHDTTSFYVLEMNDGTVLTGKIIERKGNALYFRDNNTGLTILRIGKISSLEKISTDSYFIFYMKDGSFLHGRITRYSDREIVIETNNIGIRTIPLERVKEMKQIEEKDIHRKGKYWYPNMNTSRYFFGPSAIPLKKSDGYFQTADFLVNAAHYGITNNFSIGGGAVIPFAVFLLPKYSIKVKENFHVGGGAVYLNTLLKYRQNNYKIGALYGLATYGTHNANITFGAGYGFTEANKTVDYFHKPVIMFSGSARISRRMALVAENILVPIKFSYYNASGKVTEHNYKHAYIYGFRMMKEKTTIDFGFLHYPQDIFQAFIYLDFVWRF